jgi:hypothetical protein
MRRLTVLASLAALLLTLAPGAAQAAPSTRFMEHAVVVSCEATTSDGFVSMFVAVSDLFGAFGGLEFWETGIEPFEDAPTIVAASADVSGDATAMSATFDLVEWDETQDPPFGDPAGTAVLDAALSPDGDVVDVSDRFRDGNRWDTVSGTMQPLRAEGTLTLPGEDLDDLSGCDAAEQHLTYFSTNPSAYNDRFREFVVSCSWEGDGFVDLFVRADAFETFGDVFISGPSTEIGGFGDATLSPTEMTFEAELEDFIGGGTVGSAEATATLAATGVTERFVDRIDRERYKVVAEIYSVDGSLDVTIGGTTTTYPIDDEHCYAADQRVAFHVVQPSGPKPKPLANDLPEDAAPLRLGHTAKVLTGGNAFEPEAGCTTVYPGDTEEVDVEITYTAWWTVTGTGGDLTADTAGSGFDTVVGIYTDGPSGLEQVVCVDDVGEPEFSFQARATWSSTVGKTYYIQAGGWGGSTGTLRLVVE